VGLDEPDVRGGDLRLRVRAAQRARLSFRAWGGEARLLPSLPLPTPLITA
jgi:hypothetical protein